jgi:predicted ATPase
MLSLPNDGRYPTPELAPEQRRQKTLEALISQVEVFARQSPVLMILEDAHWTDPTSLEAFGRVIAYIRRIPVLLIVTFRPDFDAPWIGRPHVASIAINRLGERDIGAMIDAVLGNKQLPFNVRETAAPQLRDMRHAFGPLSSHRSAPQTQTARVVRLKPDDGPCAGCYLPTSEEV